MICFADDKGLECSFDNSPMTRRDVVIINMQCGLYGFEGGFGGTAICPRAVGCKVARESKQHFWDICSKDYECCERNLLT